MGAPLDQAKRRVQRAIKRRLIPWFLTHQRDLPWRRNRTPYRVWIAESMLTQTRVDQVIPYYRRFLRAFPSIRRLAGASSDALMKQWEGLGYYSRARNLRAAAQIIVAEHGGRFPRNYEAIRALPGVGPYMAAAIASLAFGQNYAVLDGNVIRVLTRLFAYDGDTSKGATRRVLQSVADDVLIPGQAGEGNEALMELGATVCLPRNPLCAHCPMASVCAGYQAGEPTAYPRRSPKKKVPHKEVGAGVIVNRKGQVLIAQRRAEAMLGGLWEFPGGTCEAGEAMPDCVARELREELGIGVEIGDRLMVVRHAYSHFTIALHVYWCRIRKGRPRPIECADYRWCTIADLRQYPFSRADLHVVDKLMMARHVQLQ